MNVNPACQIDNCGGLLSGGEVWDLAHVDDLVAVLIQIREAGDSRRDLLLARPGIAPLPDMIIWRIKNGPYFELRDIHQSDDPKKNPFSKFFGYVFQEYVGLLLEDSFAEGDVLPEIPYGKPQEMGPDWIIRLGNVGIAIECTNSDLSLPTKILPKRQEVYGEFKRKYVDKIRKLPDKIEALTKPSSPYFDRLSGISRWHYLIIYSL